MAETGGKNEDVLLLSELSPETQQLVQQVQATKRPLTIVQDGTPAAVLVDAHEYALLQRRLVLQRLILDGKRDIAAGRTHTQQEVEGMMDEWFGDGK